MVPTKMMENTVGPHDFEPLSWLRPNECRHCYGSESMHCDRGWMPARPVHEVQGARAETRLAIAVIGLTLLAALRIALIIFPWYAVRWGSQ